MNKYKTYLLSFVIGILPFSSSNLWAMEQGGSIMHHANSEDEGG